MGDQGTATSGIPSQPAKRIVIVGGVAGGASTAARARRLSENAQIVMFERGEDVSFANCGLPYHIGGAIPTREQLLIQTPASLRSRFAIDVRVRTEVTRIDRDRKTLTVRDLSSGVESSVPYDQLVLSPGAEPIRPPLPGVRARRVLTLRNLTDMDAIKSVVDGQKSLHAVVVGGGYIGLEMAEALRARGAAVTLVELLPQVMGPIDPEMATPLHQELRLHGVDLVLEASVKSFEETGDRLQVQLSTGAQLTCDLAILAVGVRPEVNLAREAGLAIGPRGGIRVDPHMCTSDPNIFAVGDAVEVTDFVGGVEALIPLAGPANRQGRIAADNIFGRPSTYKRTQGTAVCKVFNLTVAMTGISEKLAKKLGVKYQKVYLHPASHASYYPGGRAVHLKVLFDPESGRLLGAQAVGGEGVDKRADILAVAIRTGLTVYDLEDMELCYAPPYGSAKDPINQVGFVASNLLRGDVGVCHADEVLARREDQVVLDVRTAAEFEAGHVDGAKHIPIDDLRSRIGELTNHREYLVYCQVGIRSYLACRILGQSGFRSRYLSGGYATYGMFNGSRSGNGARTEIRDPERSQKLPASSPVAPSISCAQPDARSATGAPGVTGAAGTAGSPDAARGTPPDIKGAVGQVVVRELDARGLQCPGPILCLKSGLDQIATGQALAILSTDVGFLADAPAWCKSTGNTLVGIAPVDDHYRATIVKGQAACAPDAGAATGKNKSIVVFSADFDKVMAAFIIANGAVSMGGKVTLFFTFWGLNVLRRRQPAAVQKSLVERMFAWMMPRGPDQLALSRMNMGGLGTAMIQHVMREKKVSPLPQLIESARRSGVKLVACTMSMDLMGIKKEELIDGVELGGVALYLNHAESGCVNLFI